MTRQFLYWKPVWEKNVRGEDFLSNVPDIIANRYRGTLLERILNMAPKHPISFELAAKLAGKRFFEASRAHRFGYEQGECHWYFNNFVEWISEQGYHIDLTGDEFEPYLTTNKLS